uniref:Uncharacterized protein n=1 Tax=Pyxicephalus adspersus TaxID=30357 RepID=A0AAV3AH80_PYXAD|nr:TPA: hypothetical protein GDO54_014317 [Pyxicephalus adspersus]
MRKDGNLYAGVYNESTHTDQYQILTFVPPNGTQDGGCDLFILSHRIRNTSLLVKPEDQAEAPHQHPITIHIEEGIQETS